MEQDRIHIKLARRTPEERQADETRRLDPFMRALKAIHTAATPETMNVEDLEKQRKGQELLGRLVAPMAGMSWEPFELDGMNCAWVRPHRGHDRRRAILYCHGGGYTSLMWIWSCSIVEVLLVNCSDYTTGLPEKKGWIARIPLAAEDGTWYDRPRLC